MRAICTSPSARKDAKGRPCAANAVAKAPADGYHLIVGGLSNMALNAGLYKNPG